MIVHALPPASTPAPVEVSHHCPKNSRDCFPHDMTGPQANRGSGRIAYTVWVAGYETVKADDGEPISESFVTDVIHLNLPSGGEFGWGEVKLIQDWVEQNMPGYTVMDAQAERDALAFAEF